MINVDNAGRILARFAVAMLLLYPLKLSLAIFLPERDVANVAAWVRTKTKQINAIPAVERVIFAGGSSGYFGLSAEHFTKETGLETFNFALHGGLGAKTNLELAIEVARPGDTIIWMPEYSTLVAHAPPTALADGLIFALRRFDWMTPGLFLRAVLLATPVTEGAGLVKAGPYSASAIGPRGDNLATNAPVGPDGGGCIATPDFSSSGIILAEAAHQAAKKQIRLRFAFAALSDRDCHQRLMPAFQALAEAVSTAGIETTLTPADMLRAKTDFLDTPYHLNATGARARTDQLIAALGHSKRAM